MSLLPTEFFTGTQELGVQRAFPEEGYQSTYRFVTDFTDDDDPPATDVIDGTDALVQLATKSLKTRRAAYLAYGPDFGSDLGVYMDTEPAAGAGRDATLHAYALDALKAVRLVETVLDLEVTVTNEGTNELEVTGTLVDTFGASTLFSATFVP